MSIGLRLIGRFLSVLWASEFLALVLLALMLAMRRRRMGRLRGFSCHMHVLHDVVVESEKLSRLLWCSDIATGGTGAGAVDDVDIGVATATATCRGPRRRGGRSTGVAYECKD